MIEDHVAAVRAEVEAGKLAPHRALDEVQRRWEQTMRDIIREARAAGVWTTDDLTNPEAEGQASSPPEKADSGVGNKDRATRQTTVRQKRK
ncbi:MAG: hypothetical protein EB165_03595 [Euryarchaeota archaeon]|jgi:hypothetical protein|nr:hypothetical protein [Euryarchaeota archaeon]